MSRLSRRQYIAMGVAFSSGILAGCLDETLGLDQGSATEGDENPDWEPADGSPLDAAVDTVSAVVDLTIPWDIVFADDDVFVTERDSGVLRFDQDTVTSGENQTPEDGDVVLSREDLADHEGYGEGGTLGVAVHPDYPEVSELFVYYTADDTELHNRVVRYDLESAAFETIVDDIPADGNHNGGRITFGPGDHLWILTGDAEDPDLTQDPSSLAGATLRVTPDGETVDDPVFDDGDPRAYTIGHRNPQGIAFTPDGTPIVSDHGPIARDEVLVLSSGANSGWDTVRGGPDDPDYGSYDEHDEFDPPIINTGFEETWAPSGIVFYDDDTIAAWENRLFVAGLVSETLFAITLESGDDSVWDDGKLEDGAIQYDEPWLDDQFVATAHPLLEGEFGRLRHAEVGPDGSLYVLTSNEDGRAAGEFPVEGDDRIVRIEPS